MSNFRKDTGKSSSVVENESGAFSSTSPEREAELRWSAYEKERLSKWLKFKKELKRFSRNPLSVTGAVLIIIFAAIALAAPWLAPPAEDRLNEPYRMPRDGFSPIPTPPNPEAWNTFPPDWRLHPMGTMQGQYDIYYGIVWGARNAFRIGVFVVGFSLFFGIIVGLLAGFYSGWVDSLLMRFVDILLAFPNIILAIILVTIFGNSYATVFGSEIYISRLSVIIVALVMTQWLVYSRLIRGDILAVKEKEFVQAARSIGASNWRIVSRHVLPNVIFPVIIAASLDIGSVVLTIAALSFIGVGPGIDFADWGQIISYSRDWIKGPENDPFKYWYVIVIPSAAITLFVLAWNLLGDAFRDILDPKLKGR
jgi:peptide/nickel transport system permease protein